MKFNAKNLFAKPSFSASVSVFFVWAKKKVVTPLDYTRYFSGAGVAGLGYRGYSAWSSSYSVIGAGKYWGNGSGIVLSKSYYWLLLGEGSIFASLYNAVKSKAEKEI